MKIHPFMAASAILIFIAGCGRMREEAPAGETGKQTTAAAAPGAAAGQSQDLLQRQFIRTSEMKFRVKDVAQATYRIEELTRNAHGFVTYTHMESAVEEQNTHPVSVDSAIEIQRYTVMNNMILRVPNTQLDSTLKAIASLVDYLDYRTIKADDVALQMKANQMTQDRALNNEARLQQAISGKGKKLGETADVENTTMERRKEADEAELSTLSLKDQVAYSTISLSLYQRTVTERQVVANPDHAGDYRTGLGLRLRESLSAGWHMVEDLAVLLTRLWLLLLLALAGFLLYRKYRPGKLALKS